MRDSLNVATTQLPQDTEEFIVHRAEVIKLEVDFLRKQIETIVRGLIREQGSNIKRRRAVPAAMAACK